jgi:uncharacterized protein (DUF433 family)
MADQDNAFASSSLTPAGKSPYAQIMQTRDLITIDPQILGGTPVFKGTRVPVKTLFDYLNDNYTLAEFLDSFPSVTRDMAVEILQQSESALLSSSPPSTIC